MSAEPVGHLFGYLGASIDVALKSYVADASSRVSSALVPPVTTGFTLWIWWRGWGVLLGRAEHSVLHFASGTLRCAVILAFALGTGTYQGLLIDAVLGFANDWAALFAPAPDLDLYANFDLIAQLGSDLGNKLALRGVSSLPFGGYVDIACAIAVVTETGIMVVGLGGLALVTHVGLSVLLGVGPAFIAALMFSVSARLFFAWLSQLLKYILLLGMLTFLVSIVLRVYADYMNSANGLEASSINALRELLEVTVLSGAILFTVLHLPNLAAGLAQGAAIGNIDEGTTQMKAGGQAIRGFARGSSIGG